MTDPPDDETTERHKRHTDPPPSPHIVDALVLVLVLTVLGALALLVALR